MHQSFVRMMNRIAEMENCILKGLVLDEHGNWLSIADRKVIEADSLAHLAAGQVLFEGRWVSFHEVRKSRTRRIEKAPPIGGRPRGAALQNAKTAVFKTPFEAIAVERPAPEKTPPDTTVIAETAIMTHPLPPAPEKPPEPVPETPVAPETAVMTQSPPPAPEKTAKPPVPVPETPFPPETAVMTEKPQSSSEKEGVHGEFAPETKIILIKPPEPSTPAVSDTQVVKQPDDTKLFRPPPPVLPEPSEEERQSTLKKRIVLITGAIIVVATVTAVVLIVLQTLR